MIEIIVPLYFLIGIALIALGAVTWSLGDKIQKLERKATHLNQRLEDLKRELHGELPHSGGSYWNED